MRLPFFVWAQFVTGFLLLLAFPPLEAAGLQPEIATVTMRAENPVALAGEDAERMQKLLDVLEDLDDVQNVFHNAEISE